MVRGLDLVLGRQRLWKTDCGWSSVTRSDRARKHCGFPVLSFQDQGPLHVSASLRLGVAIGPALAAGMRMEVSYVSSRGSVKSLYAISTMTVGYRPPQPQLLSPST